MECLIPLNVTLQREGTVREEVQGREKVWAERRYIAERRYVRAVVWGREKVCSCCCMGQREGMFVLLYGAERRYVRAVVID